MYVIKTNGEKGILFLADRNKTKRYWWTYAMNLVMKFKSLVEADRVATRLKYNNATVISLDEAYRIRERIESAYEKERTERMMDNINYEEGWDGHKDSF